MNIFKRLATRTILGLLLLLALAPVRAESPFTISGISGAVLTNIEKRLNELQKTKPVNEYNLDDLRSQIINSIEPFGYFKAIVDIHLNGKNSVSINIQPGPQLRIASFNIDLIGPGSQNPKLLHIVKDIPIKVGGPLLTDQYNKTKQNLVNTAENLGYLHSNFKKAEILIDANKYSAQISLIFDTGPLYYFGQIQFDPTNIDPKLLHRFIPFKPGEAYSTDKILKLNTYLSGSGYFNSVLVNPQITDSQTVPIDIHLQPISKYSYSWGAGYGTDTGIRGRAGLNVIPVNKWGHKFNAVAQGSFNQNVLQAQYIVPAKNPVTDQYSLTGNFSNLNYSTGSSNSVLVSLAKQHNLEKFQRVLSINGLSERYKYYSLSDTDQFLLYPKASFTFRNISNKLFTPTGFTIALNGFAASKSVLSDINVAQLAVDAKGALMLEPLRLRLYGHSLQGITQTNDITKLPLSLALLLGGSDNLKGFSFNSIGPGRIISYGGFELQKEVVKNWYVVGFYDAGAVYNPTEKITHYDAGAGLMWVSPIGPIKAGLAQPITNGFERYGNSSPRLVISMGPDL